VHGDVFTSEVDVESSEIHPRYLRGGRIHLEGDHLQAGMCEGPRIHADAAAGVDHRSDARRRDPVRPADRHLGWTRLLHPVDGHQRKRVVGWSVPRLRQGRSKPIPVEARQDRTGPQRVYTRQCAYRLAALTSDQPGDRFVAVGHWRLVSVTRAEWSDAPGVLESQIEGMVEGSRGRPMESSGDRER
jgi:hypothetical protein